MNIEEIAEALGADVIIENPLGLSRPFSIMDIFALREFFDRRQTQLREQGFSADDQTTRSQPEV